MALVFMLLLLLIPSPITAIDEADDVTSSTQNEEFEIRMPGARVSKTNVHLCHTIQVNSNETIYITGYEPLLDSSVAHHATLFVCKNPALPDEIWNCGGARVKEPAYAIGRVCADSNNNIPQIYDWVKDGESYRMPPGVGFPIGGDTGYLIIVLQIHYNRTERASVTVNDTSGIKIIFTRTAPEKLMGIYIVDTRGQFLPNQIEHAESACSVPIRTTEQLHVFAYLVHTHDLGLMVSGYRVRNGTWTAIGQRDPQLPQSIIPTSALLAPGDWIALRCTMRNTKSYIVRIGFNYEDEMCQFYAWYYTESGAFIPQLNCGSAGPANYYWRTDTHLDSQNAPAPVDVNSPPD